MRGSRPARESSIVFSSETDVAGGCSLELSYLAALHKGLFKKHGAVTIVNFDILDQILEASPDAEISPSAA